MHALSKIQNITEGKIYFIQISDVNTTDALTFTSVFYSNTVHFWKRNVTQLFSNRVIQECRY